ncbi:hypothetical protein [Phyllobacterium sp. 22552]|uniref:hypothetical protein n=1 Tax=Phyllobacterium sp. 22552 TaxID=3453941 RepID=UPI003F834021
MVKQPPSSSLGFLRAEYAPSIRVRHPIIILMNIFLNESQARARFKSMLGNANHLIITSLVGLDGVERGLVTDIPQELRAAWSPKNPVASARRTRRLVLDMALVRAVDSLDMYMSYSRRIPYLIQDPKLQNDIDNAGSSVAKKFNSLSRYHTSLSPVLISMTSLMIAWRNRAAHAEADVDIDRHKIQVLIGAKDSIANQYRGLDVNEMIVGFETSEPSFKEVASLIHAVQNTIQELEALQLSKLNAEKYLRELIWMKIGDSQGKISADENYRLKRIQSIWGKDEKERSEVVFRFLLTSGLSNVKKYQHSVKFNENLIKDVSQMTPRLMWVWLNDR